MAGDSSARIETAKVFAGSSDFLGGFRGIESIDSFENGTIGNAEDEIFAGILRGKLLHAFSGSGEAVNGFQPPRVCLYLTGENVESKVLHLGAALKLVCY